jgi:hypothetical protein
MAGYEIGGDDRINVVLALDGYDRFDGKNADDTLEGIAGIDILTGDTGTIEEKEVLEVILLMATYETMF